MADEVRYEAKSSDDYSYGPSVELTRWHYGMGWTTTIAIKDLPIVIKRLAAFIPEEN